MKKIVFIRHAKSSWDYDASDIDRPLKMRGIEDAYLVADKLKNHLSTPDKIVSSPANRAIHTALIFLRQLNIDPSLISINQSLYDFEGTSLMENIQNTDNQINTLMLFGHNHAMTSVVNMLGNKFIDNVPTAGVVVINFTSSTWQQVTKEQGTTELTLFPKDFK